MKKFLFLVVFIATFNTVFSQPPGYYNGTAGLSGEALKAQIHEIINNHVDFSYSQAKFLINYSDADPYNENNVILFYTQRSQDADTYGSEGDFINREHVWAKSHGDFSGIRPMDGDAYNLRPADASVNMDKSNKDFGIVQPNGTEHHEATGNWYNGYAWEPGPDTKGQVARILFYMDNRYEGTNGEIDLTVVNGFNTYPKPEHGDKAALLLWNREYLPTDFERRRNERLFSIQQNRNPFVDNPQWVDMIWADMPANPIEIDNLSMTPEIPYAGETPQLTFTIESELEIDQVHFFWGNTYDSQEHSIILSVEQTSFTVPFSLDNFEGEDMVYFKITAHSQEQSNTMRGSFLLPRNISIDDITPINEVQGTGNTSPLENQTVTTTGRITANFDNTVYIQTGTEPYSGMCIFAPLKTGHIGDSVVVTGRVIEYQQLTEIGDVEYFFNYKSQQAYEPLVLKINEISEKYEGMLVTIENVIFEDGGTVVPDQNSSYKFSDNTGTLSTYFRYGSRMVNKAIPHGVTHVTGVLSQYGDDYQLLPRDIYDFSAGQDSVPPKVSKVNPISSEWITIDFNERVDKASSEDLNNYSIDNDVDIISAFRYEEATTVILNVATLSSGVYTLTVSGVMDESGNAMGTQQIEFETDFSSSVHELKNTTKVFPNPTNKGELNIESFSEIESIELTDMLGRKLISKAVNNTSYQLPLDISPGIYLLKINMHNKQSLSEKVIIQ